jgi:hypothetical protein
MLDYVPHGPYLYGPEEGNTDIYDNPWMTPARFAWVGTDRDDKYGNEWNCWALDAANQNYLGYIYNLANKQAQEFGIIGARIDASFGSVPNWTPFGYNRISQTGLFGGASMVKAIRDGIHDAGKTALIYPEPLWPIPYYAPASGILT